MSITVNVGQILLPLSSTCSELRGATSTWENSWDTYTVGETIIGLSSQNSEVDARKERGSISLLTHNIDPVSIYNYYIIFNITHKLVIILLIVLALVCISAYTVMWESPNLTITFWLAVVSARGCIYLPAYDITLLTVQLHGEGGGGLQEKMGKPNIWGPNTREKQMKIIELNNFSVLKI